MDLYIIQYGIQVWYYTILYYANLSGFSYNNGDGKMKQFLVN